MSDTNNTQVTSFSSSSSSSSSTSVVGEKRPRRPWELKGLSSVTLDQMVGSGTFGVVFKASERESGEKLALKKIKIEPNSSQGFPVTAIREIRILKSLKHENIVQLKEIIVYKPEDDDEEQKRNEIFETGGLNIGDIFMVFEYCFSDLSGLLKTKEVVFTEAHVKCYMKQLLTGLHHLYAKKILHRDIKSANILVTNNNIVKIADLGLARTYYDTSKQDFTNPVVTLWYRSPELLLGCKRYGNEVDIWSIGCVFCEMKERTAPLRAENETNQLEKIFELCGYPNPTVLEEYKKYPDYEKYVSIVTPPHPNMTPRLRHRYNRFGENDLNLLEKLLDINPRTRITATAALDHDYFWLERTPTPQELKPFDTYITDSVTEHLVQKKHREDAQKTKEAEKALLEKKKEDEKLRRDHHSNFNSNSSHNTFGRGGGGQGRGGHDNHVPPSQRYRGLQTNKYKVLDNPPPPPPK